MPPLMLALEGIKYTVQVIDCMKNGLTYTRRCVSVLHRFQYMQPSHRSVFLLKDKLKLAVHMWFQNAELNGDVNHKKKQ